jgi:hypothetical protein
MKARAWYHALLAVALVGIAAALTLSFRLVSQIEWRSTPQWQLLFELLAALTAAQVAAFALSRFGLERRRLPLFIGLGFFGAAISDLIAALVSQGNYVQPLVGRTTRVTDERRVRLVGGGKHHVHELILVLGRHSDAVWHRAHVGNIKQAVVGRAVLR